MTHCIIVIRMATAKLLTSTQAGLLIGKSSRTVIRLIEAGEIPVLGKLDGPNGPYVIQQTDVVAYMDRAKASA
ncbi:excise [Gordonia phage Phishy]|nr:excise [Gordonia phage Phishy]